MKGLKAFPISYGNYDLTTLSNILKTFLLLMNHLKVFLKVLVPSEQYYCTYESQLWVVTGYDSLGFQLLPSFPKVAYINHQLHAFDSNRQVTKTCYTKKHSDTFQRYQNSRDFFCRPRLEDALALTSNAAHPVDVVALDVLGQNMTGAQNGSENADL